MTLGSHIAALRAAQGLSQAELAELLEVSRQSVSKWETDASVPELDKLLRLAQIFHITLDQLVTGDAPEAETPVETVHTPEPACPAPQQPLRVTVGSVLLFFGGSLALIFSLQGNWLTAVLMVSLPFLSCGAVCLLLKDLLPLWCGWCVFLSLFLCNSWTPKLFWYNSAVMLLALAGLLVLTGWAFRDRLLGSAKRRRLLAWSWSAGAVLYLVLQRVGWNFYGTYIMWLSSDENHRRQLFGKIVLELSMPLAFALISTALAAIFYYGRKLLRRLVKLFQKKRS